MKFYLALLLLAFGCQTTSIFPKNANPGGLVIVEYGADWCPGCVYYHPILEKKAAELKAQFIYVDVDNDESYKNLHQIYFIPNVELIMNGKLYYFGPPIKDLGRLIQELEDDQALYLLSKED